MPMKHLATGESPTTTTGEILKESTSGLFKFRLVKRDWKPLPDIERQFNNEKWTLLISCPSQADIARFFN